MQEEMIPTKPYLLRALYEWCTDNGFTPHIAVRVDNRTRVPRQFVRNGEIVLNISFGATGQLKIGNEMIEFLARFSGKSHKIEVPVANVMAIYARENNEGMAFPLEEPDDGELDADNDETVLSSELDEGDAPESGSAAEKEAARDDDKNGEDPHDGKYGKDGKGGRPHLRRVK